VFFFEKHLFPLLAGIAISLQITKKTVAIATVLK
jgi:hypothetical protein